MSPKSALGLLWLFVAVKLIFLVTARPSGPKIISRLNFMADSGLLQLSKSFSLSFHCYKLGQNRPFPQQKFPSQKNSKNITRLVTITPIFVYIDILDLANWKSIDSL